jgi:hypothetical protein
MAVHGGKETPNLDRDKFKAVKRVTALEVPKKQCNNFMTLLKG